MCRDPASMQPRHSTCSGLEGRNAEFGIWHNMTDTVGRKAWLQIVLVRSDKLENVVRHCHSPHGHKLS